jgi:NADH-quinone oxidoreductase subunit E
MCGTNDETIDLSLMEPILSKYAGERGALIPILQKAQDAYGYLPPQVLQLIAKRQGVAISKVYGVATFYSQFYLERRGRHVLKVCDGTACHVKGTPGLLDAIHEEYGIAPGQTTEDYELTLEVVYCLGSCALAPIALLDEQVMGQLEKKSLLKQVKNQMAKPTEK